MGGQGTREGSGAGDKERGIGDGGDVFQIMGTYTGYFTSGGGTVNQTSRFIPERTHRRR